MIFYSAFALYGGSTTANVTINVNPEPGFTTTTTDVTCAALGSIVLSTTSGTAPFQYSNDNGSSFQGLNTFSSIGAGTYEVVVQDANTCESTQSVTVNTIAPFSVDNVTTTDETCAIGGTITITVSGGTPPIEYSIDGGMTYSPTNNYAGLSSGTYNISIRDASLCVVDQNATVNTASAVSITDITSTDETCGAQGTITINTTGGLAPIEYSLDRITFQPYRRKLHDYRERC